MQVLPVLEDTRTNAACNTCIYIQVACTPTFVTLDSLDHSIGHILFLGFVCSPCLLQDPLALRSPMSLAIKSPTP